MKGKFRYFHISHVCRCVGMKTKGTQMSVNATRHHPVLLFLMRNRGGKDVFERWRADLPESLCSTFLARINHRPIDSQQLISRNRCTLSHLSLGSREVTSFLRSSGISPEAFTTAGMMNVYIAIPWDLGQEVYTKNHTRRGQVVFRKHPSSWRFM